MITNLDEMFPTVTLNEDLVTRPTPWLIDGLWQRGKINAIAGYVKKGKSRVVNWMIAALLAGKPVFGLRTEEVERVLYLAGEETIEHINTRLVQYLREQDTPLDVLSKVDVISAAGMRLDFDRYRQWLGAKLPRYDLVVIDPLRRVHGGDENDNSQMAVLNNSLRQWTNTMGHTLLFIHHTPKPSHDGPDLTRMEAWFRGAGDFAAIVDTAVFIDRKTATDVLIRREGRYAPLPPLDIRDLGGEPDRGFR